MSLYLVRRGILKNRHQSNEFWIGQHFVVSLEKGKGKVLDIFMPDKQFGLTTNLEYVKKKYGKIPMITARDLMKKIGKDVYKRLVKEFGGAFRKPMNTFHAPPEKSKEELPAKKPAIKQPVAKPAMPKPATSTTTQPIKSPEKPQPVTSTTKTSSPEEKPVEQKPKINF